MNQQDSFVLLYGPSPGDWETLSSALEGAGLQVVPVRNFLEAVDLAQADCFALILVDCDGEPQLRSVVSAFVTRAPAAAVVVCSRLAEEARWLDALEAGASDYICKPISRHDVDWMLAKAFDPRAHRRSTLKPACARVREVARACERA